MRIIALFSLCFIALVAYTSAQGCVEPARPDCVGGLNVGRGGPGSNRRTMWYWNFRICQSFIYLGRGGNNNRHCSREACERRCRRLT